MPQTIDRIFGACLSVIFLIIGAFLCVASVLALVHGTDVSIPVRGRTEVLISPYLAISEGVFFAGMGAYFLVRLWKERSDEFRL
jgi:hypothetical protein